MGRVHGLRIRLVGAMHVHRVDGRERLQNRIGKPLVAFVGLACVKRLKPDLIEGLELNVHHVEVLSDHLDLLAHFVRYQLLLKDVGVQVLVSLLMQFFCVACHLLEIGKEVWLLSDRFSDGILIPEVVLGLLQSRKDAFNFVLIVNHTFEVFHFFHFLN